MKRLRTVLAAAALTALLCGIAHAADLSRAGGAHVEVGEPVTPIRIDVALRQLPGAPQGQPGRAIKEAHKP